MALPNSRSLSRWRKLVTCVRLPHPSCYWLNFWENERKKYAKTNFGHAEVRMTDKSHLSEPCLLHLNQSKLPPKRAKLLGNQGIDVAKCGSIEKNRTQRSGSSGEIEANWKSQWSLILHTTSPLRRELAMVVTLKYFATKSTFADSTELRTLW